MSQSTARSAGRIRNILRNPKSSGIRLTPHRPTAPDRSTNYVSRSRPNSIATTLDTLNSMEPLLPKELLNVNGIVKISTFLMYAPRFKEDIVLVLDGQSPVDVPPAFLPTSIAAFLAQLCDLSDEAIGALWDLLKSAVWSWEEKVQTIGARYQLYGHNLGYRRFFGNMCTTIN